MGLGEEAHWSSTGSLGLKCVWSQLWMPGRRRLPACGLLGFTSPLHPTQAVCISPSFTLPLGEERMETREGRTAELNIFPLRKTHLGNS